MTTLPPSYSGGTGSGGATTFTDLIDTFDDYIGREAQILRVNSSGTGIESISQSTSVPNTVYVSSESDLPALNAQNEHELAANTNYFFTGNISIANPLRVTTTTTELSGNGIGMSKVTYTGSGYAIRADNGLSSVRMKFFQLICSSGDGVIHVGGGPNSGANISLDRAYVIAPNGTAINTTECDFLFTSAAVVHGQIPIVIAGACGILAAELTEVRGYLDNQSLIDFGTCTFDDMVVSSILFNPASGVTGLTAISGQANSANVNGSASFSGCVVDEGIVALSGITSNDVKYKFSGNFGISDSKTLLNSYILSSATTDVLDGTPVQVAGTWTQTATSSRVLTSAVGESTFSNNEEETFSVSASISINRVTGGGSGDYTMFVEKRPSGGSFAAIEGMSKSFTLDSNNISSITWVGSVSLVSGDTVRITIQGEATDTDTVAVTGSFVIS